jgi:hypothetical protein
MTWHIMSVWLFLLKRDRNKKKMLTFFDKLPLNDFANISDILRPCCSGKITKLRLFSRQHGRRIYAIFGRFFRQNYSKVASFKKVVVEELVANGRLKPSLNTAIAAITLKFALAPRLLDYYDLQITFRLKLSTFFVLDGNLSYGSIN